MPLLHLALFVLGSWPLPGAGEHLPGGKDPLDPEAVRYGRDVRPILSDRCFACHGADADTRRADLRLDRFEEATRSRRGRAPLVPGDPDSSELLRRVQSADPDEAMPPPEAKRHPLDAREREVLRRWIEEGAEYEEHWAFVAPVRPPLPVVRAAAWPRVALDHFVLAGLERAGVPPSSPADLATLTRRVYLDVTGLAPTVPELQAVLEAGRGTAAAAAYEELVERLLTEEPYRSRHAEHVAATWLDAARYADTIGIHTDNGRQTWLWRDWVLKALRDGMPYDRFVTEQLAGDLLPEATPEQRVASGFNRNHVITDEGGAIDAEYLVEYAVDRVNTTSTVFLGLTAGCARCHDHKYDPFTQLDYYSLLAFFNSNEEPGLYSQTPDSNRAYEPFLEVPTPEQSARLDALGARVAALGAELAQPLPGEDGERLRFEVDLAARAGLDWSTARVLSASSSDPLVTLTLADDGSVQASGPQPEFEDYTLLLALDEPAQRLLLIEALATPGAGPGGGRASHGNAVVSGLRLELNEGPGTAPRALPLRWAWSDHAQRDRDFEASNVLVAGDSLGWALDGNELAGERDLLLLLDEPLGASEGAELRLTLEFRSEYAQHALGRLRVRSSQLADTGTLPVAHGRWYRLGPFLEKSVEGLYDRQHGPELAARLDLAAEYGPSKSPWDFEPGAQDGAVFALPDGIGISYLGRTLWSPDERTIQVSLGSDDGLQVYLRGELVFERRIDRGAAPDQERIDLELHPGANALVLKLVNTGGACGSYYRQLTGEGVLEGELASALLPGDAVSAEQAQDFHTAWRRRFFEAYRELDDDRTAREAELAALRSEVPRTMVMSELAEPRPTFVLVRGQYDHADAERPVERRAPGFLPALPPRAPRDRLGLAHWMTAPEHPLFARVAVNRLWQGLFGAGLVRTPEDFGLQGEWPTHPELLDWLAVELRECGWDERALLRQILLSSTYRQASAVRPELDGEEARLLAAYPRRRLSAEQIRDHALHVSGLLVEQFGGPSVKPYQPEGLWREVAMPQSNTSAFEVGVADEVWRRSLYTFWKRASPPPGLMALDAPTRESCVLQRQSTNTPLQALVLWNDVQFAEAARALAGRALAAAAGDEQRVAWLLLACTARRATPGELDLFLEALAGFRERFRQAPEDADALLSVGRAALPEQSDSSELAAWTLLANASLNLHETLTQD